MGDLIFLMSTKRVASIPIGEMIQPKRDVGTTANNAIPRTYPMSQSTIPQPKASSISTFLICEVYQMQIGKRALEYGYVGRNN